MTNLNTKITHIDGFDYLRCLGLILVVVQHQFSIMDLERFTSFKNINVGQIGVAIFLALSGVLALQTERSPKDWLIARLCKVYPAYWIASIFGFIAAGFSGYKTFDVFQIVSQLAGTGLLTHRNHLVNVANWFVSLLLGLYVVVFISRLTGRSRLVVASLAICCCFFVIFNFEPLISAHAATFFLAAVLFGSHQQARYLNIILPTLFVLAIPSRPLFYPAIAILLSAASFSLPAPPRIVLFVSRYSYEFYLIHGIFMVGSQKLIGDVPLVSIPLGIVSSMVAAVLLSRGTSSLISMIARCRTK